MTIIAGEVLCNDVLNLLIERVPLAWGLVLSAYADALALPGLPLRDRAALRRSYAMAAVSAQERRVSPFDRETA